MKKGTYHHSPETRAKISASNRGKQDAKRVWVRQADGSLRGEEVRIVPNRTRQARVRGLPPHFLREIERGIRTPPK